jgi:hypothetical protein
MAIFIFKIMTLLVRTIAKPMISWASYYKRIKLQQAEYKDHWIRHHVANVGQVVNYYNTKINRKMFKLSTTDPIKLLSEEKAIEKGAEFVSEFLIYAVLISLPVFEWIRQSRINKLKEQVKEQGIRRMKNDLERILCENKELRGHLNELKTVLEELRIKV